MTFEETPRCQRDHEFVRAECRCSSEMRGRGPNEERCILKHTTAEFTEEKEVKGHAGRFNCRRCMLGCVDEQDNWIASYVGTRLRTMAGEDFPISRHTADFAAHAVRNRFLSDTDAVLKRILELAALRYLRDGSSTVTQEDVAVALHSFASPRG